MRRTVLLPKRRRAVRMNVREPSVIRCDAHLQWVRGHECLIFGRQGHVCRGKPRACHLRVGTDGGLSQKPSDMWTWPGCDGAHEEQHRIGEISFQAKYGTNLRVVCERLWQQSPAGKRWRARRQEVR